MDNDDDDYEENARNEREYEERFETTYGDYKGMSYERAKTVDQIASEAGLIFPITRKGEKTKDPTYKFYVYVNAVAYKLIEEGYSSIKKEEINRILEYIKNVPYPGYKNPEAFVLGYFVGKSGSINEKQFKFITSKLLDLNVSIKPMDVLRYANLWINIVNNNNKRQKWQ